jgi:hypothetical protein
MRRLLFTLVIALAATSCSKDKGKADDKAEVEHKLPDLTVDEVAAGLASKQLTAVDCNSETVRKDAGVIAGAILVADETTYPANVLPADKATKLVFYCGGPG